MSRIKTKLWQTFMGNIPMPPNCTYWQFAAARDAMWKQEDLKSSSRYIQKIKSLPVTQTLDIQAELDKLITNELERVKQL